MTDNTIVLVDDDKADQEIIRQALKQSKIESELVILDSGEKFLEFIENKNSPNLILLDLNMPKISGREVLLKLTDQQIKDRIIIILTTSDNENDIKFCYDVGVKSFITKPLDLVSYNLMVENISNYWFNDMLKLPTCV